MIPIIGGQYILPFKPVNNITPFTYRDGSTYLEVLEDIRKYVNNTLVAFINENFSGLADSFESEINTLTEVVTLAISTQSQEVSDQLVAFDTANDIKISELEAMVTASVSNVTDTLLAQTSDNTTAINGALSYVNGQISTLTTYVDDAVEGIVGSSVTANDPVVEALVTDPLSDTRVALDGIFGSAAATDNGVASNIVNISSQTRSALDSNFADKTTEVTVSEGRLSVTNLDDKISGDATVIANAAISAIDSDLITSSLILDGASDTRVSLENIYGSSSSDSKWRAFRPKLINMFPGIDSFVDGKYYFDGTEIHVEAYIGASVNATAPMGTDPRIGTPSLVEDGAFSGTKYVSCGSGIIVDATTGLSYNVNVVRNTNFKSHVFPRFATTTIQTITAGNPISWGILDSIAVKFSYRPKNAIAPKNFLAYGDSISRFESTAADPTVWPLLVGEEGLAFGGGWAGDSATTAQILAGARKLNADIAVLHAGVNDIAQAVSQGATLANIVAIKAKVGADKFMVSKLAPYNANPAAIISINGAMESWAIANDIILIDAWDGFRAAGSAGTWSAGSDNGDGVHPTPAVQTAVATTIRSEILANIS